MSPILSVISIVIVNKVVIIKVNMDIVIVSFVNSLKPLAVTINFVLKIISFLSKYKRTVTLMIRHPFSGLFYKHMTIINDDSSVVCK
jgi:hypothetical protein